MAECKRWCVLVDVASAASEETQWEVYQTAEDEAEAERVAREYERRVGRLALAYHAQVDEDGRIVLP